MSSLRDYGCYEMIVFYKDVVPTELQR